MKSYWIAQEGWPFVAVGLVTAVAGAWFGLMPVLWLGVVGAVATALFFRNPQREIPVGERLLVAPADGRVIAIDAVDDPYFGRGPMQRISIFLSVFNVHINRMPCAGLIEAAKYVPGKFLMAFAPKASTVNERNAVWIRTSNPGQEAVVVQIAGMIARRIVSYLQPGDPVERGMRYGLIRFGSRVDLYVPRDTALRVTIGDRVHGGSSVLGEFQNTVIPA